jgi:hypothetical protein
MTQQLIAGLKATKQALIDNGRCTKGARNADGNICIILAIGRGNRENSRLILVQRALAAHLPSPYHGLVHFNEDPKTVDQDVYNLIDKALAEAGGMA